MAEGSSIARWLGAALLSVSGFANAVGNPAWFANVADQFSELNPRVIAIVNVAQQELSLYENGELRASYPVSTSRYGVGSLAGSEKTPSGLHYVRKKIGDGSSPGTVFKGRVNTGYVVEPIESPYFTLEDYVTTRILWLSGLEPGHNEGEGVDSYHRYIYIHGTHEEGLIGQPASHGCIRMKNDDVIALYEQMPLESLVMIVP